MFKFPYGISNFHIIRTNNYFYVDRTSHIRLIEDAGLQLLFLRPRRFGKSLVISMLENYYDVAKAEEFEKLFGDLAIGKNPTPNHNQYFVMKWDFSNISPKGDAEQIEQRLNSYLNRCIYNFADKYQNWLPKKFDIDSENTIDSFLALLNVVQQTPYRLYLLIDEYDNFANEVMMAGNDSNHLNYKALKSAEGDLKSLFKSVKSAAGGQGLERVFITGVSPVLLTDITSSYNVAEDIYLAPKFNDLCGFTEFEIKEILSKIVTECTLPEDRLKLALRIMKTFYDGYCFSEMANQDIYNPTLALYFLKYFQENCEFPRKMLDNNLAMDRNKLSYISRLLKDDKLLFQALNENPPLSLLEMADRFGLDDMLSKTAKDNSFIISLLYYLGILTLNGENELGELSFKIPNLVIRKLYVERIFEKFLPEDTERYLAHQLAKDFYQTGDLQAICDFMEQRYFKVFDNRDYNDANELTIKTAFLTVLYDDVFYVMDSELELERRYADLTMIIRPGRRKSPIYDFILEFKFLKIGEAGLTGEKAKTLSIEELKKLAPVKQKFAQAEKQLFDYQKRLVSKYGDELKLQLISIVAVGFERVVWKRVFMDK